MEQARPIAVMIADDHPVFRKGLREVISEDHRFVVVGEAGDGDAAKQLLQELKPDVLLLDLNMPGAAGPDIATWAREQKIPANIIVLTMHKEESVFNMVMDAGVRGYILKESAVNDILEGIKTVHDGGYYISPTISQYLVNRRTKVEDLLDKNPGLNTLSPTERRILKMISENRASKDIADMLFISVRTVENHRMNICNKLNLHGSNGLLKFAIENRSSL